MRCDEFSERGRSTSAAEQEVCLPMTVYVRDKTAVWRWEFLSSDTNVSAEHPVDWEHVEADGASGPPAH